MKHALTQQGKFSPAIAHPLYELEFIDLSFDDPIVSEQSQTGRHRRFISFHAKNEATEFSDLASSCLKQPCFKFLSRAGSEHLDELLYQVIHLVQL